MGELARLLREVAATMPWQPLLLVLARLLPLVLLTPVFGGPLLPARMRLCVAVAFALPLALGLPAHASDVLRGEAVAHGIAMLRELAIGGSIALVVRMLFESLAATGALVDVARGASAAAQNDPSMTATATPLATGMRQLLLAAFFGLGGPMMLLRQIARSFAMLPLGGELPASMGPGVWFELVGRLLAAAFALAAPAVVWLFLVDVGLALANRAAPQLQAWSLGQAAKGPLGLLVLAGSLALVLGDQLEAAMDVVEHWLAAIGV